MAQIFRPNTNRQCWLETLYIFTYILYEIAPGFPGLIGFIWFWSWPSHPFWGYTLFCQWYLCRYPESGRPSKLWICLTHCQIQSFDAGDLAFQIKTLYTFFYIHKFAWLVLCIFVHRKSITVPVLKMPFPPTGNVYFIYREITRCWWLTSYFMFD